jgi:hypothetical protein
MRILSGFCIALCLATGLFAQHRSGSLGSVVYPAGAPGTPGVSRTGSSVVNPGGGGVRLTSPANRVAPRSQVVYAYPVYIGGYGGYYDPSYYTTPQDPSTVAAPSQPNVTVVMPPQAPVTPVIINLYSNGAQVRADQAPPEQAADESAASFEPSHYLIAFKDHTIYAATAYWVDGDTLHYFTDGNHHNQASLSLVDRDFTQKLNKQAGVDVTLPAPTAK